MKITKRQIRRIVKEERSKLAEQGLHSMSPAGKALANSIKGKFMRMYPDAKVGIDARGGFITVNGKKAVDMSQATGRGMSDDEMIEKLHAVYAQTQVDADVPTADSRMDTFREGKMKITKRQLKRIIKEERKKILKEQWGSGNETGSAIVDFANAWCGLGGAVQEQVGSLLSAYFNASTSGDFEEAVYEQNPNAIDMAMQRLAGPLQMMGSDESEEILDALKDAQKIYLQGDE